MRVWIGLVLWVLAILFPVALIGRFSNESKEFIDRLLEPEWLHVVMHLLIYAGLAILLAGAMHRGGRTLSPATLIVVIMLVCAVQEFLQNMSSIEWDGYRAAIRGSLFDFGVDLAGGLFGLWIFNRFNVLRKRQQRLPSQ